MKRLLTTAFIACSLLAAPVFAQTPGHEDHHERVEHKEHREEHKEHREERKDHRHERREHRRDHRHDEHHG